MMGEHALVLSGPDVGGTRLARVKVLVRFRVLVSPATVPSRVLVTTHVMQCPIPVRRQYNYGSCKVQAVRSVRQLELA